MRLLLILSALLCTATLSAQSCSDLTVTGDGSPGSTLTFDLSGAGTDAPAVILVSPNAGSTTFNLGPIGTIELGLAAPFIPLLAGRTDASGAVSLSIDVPMGGFPQVDLFAQGLTVDVQIGGGPPRLTACTSDVEGFAVGSSS